MQCTTYVNIHVCVVCGIRLTNNARHCISWFQSRSTDTAMCRFRDSDWIDVSLSTVGAGGFDLDVRDTKAGFFVDVPSCSEFRLCVTCAHLRIGRRIDCVWLGRCRRHTQLHEIVSGRGWLHEDILYSGATALVRVCDDRFGEGVGKFIGGCNDGGLGGVVPLSKSGELSALLLAAGAIQRPRVKSRETTKATFGST